MFWPKEEARRGVGPEPLRREAEGISLAAIFPTRPGLRPDIAEEGVPAG